MTNILPISIFQGSTLTHGTSPLGFLKGLTYQSSNYNNAKENDHMELLRNRLEQLKVLGPTITKSCQRFIAEVRSQMTKAKHRY